MAESLIPIMIGVSLKDTNITEIHRFEIRSSLNTVPINFSVQSHVYREGIKVSLCGRGRTTGHFLYKED